MHLNLSRPIDGSGAAGAYSPYVDPAGLGVRTIGSDTFTGELLEVLRLTADLGPPGVIEPLVRERCGRFGDEPMKGLAAVLRVGHTFDGRVEVWSRVAEGFRLSAALEWTEARGAAPSLAAALTVGDRLLAALSSLQRVDNTDGASGHGAIAIDQVVVSETGEVTLTDYAVGTALAALEWPRERLWRRFRIAMPPAAGLARFDHRVDVTQAALVICALLAGRAFKSEEYPGSLDTLVAEAVRRSPAGAPDEDRDRLRAWLRSATELEPRSAFASAAVARHALREAFGNRLDDTTAVRVWLRGPRGMTEPASGAAAQGAGQSAPVPAAADSSDVSRAPVLSRLRQWMLPR